MTDRPAHEQRHVVVGRKHHPVLPDQQDDADGTGARRPGSDIAAGTHDLATHNAFDGVADILHDILHHLLPDLDRIYVNQDVRMQNLVMDLPSPLATRLGMQPVPLADQIAVLIAALQGWPRPEGSHRYLQTSLVTPR